MKMRVRVPATTANLGPGFDLAGMALSLANTFTCTILHEGGIHATDDRYVFPDSLTLNVFFATLKKAGIPVPQHLHLQTESEIPPQRGLGSSSACIVAGLLFANHYGQLNWDKNTMMQEAIRYEGHPDNVVSAINGQANLTISDAMVFFNHAFLPHPDLCFIALIPTQPLSTAKARAVLPQTWERKDVLANLSRVALLQEAFVSGSIPLLRMVLDDHLHQPWRWPLIPHAVEIQTLLKTLPFLAGWISGSGSTVMLVCHQSSLIDVHRQLAKLALAQVEILDLSIVEEGATLQILNNNMVSQDLL